MYGINLDDELAADIPMYGWLLDRILDLPDPYPGGRFREAMSQDEEMAETLIELEEMHAEDDDRPAGTLRYSQLGLRESLLISIDTNLKAMRAEAPVIKAGKGKPKYPESHWKPPVSAVERVRKRRDEAEVERINRLFGFHDEPEPPPPAPEEPAPESPPDPAPPPSGGPVDPAMRRVWYASRMSG